MRKNLKPYPSQVCTPCAEKAHAKWPGHAAGFWHGKCDVCEQEVSVTSPRDWRWPDFKGHKKIEKISNAEYQYRLYSWGGCLISFEERKAPYLQKGDKIKFWKEKHKYTVVAANKRFAICIKPFNAQKTYLYTIIDFKEGIRGPENLIFNCTDLQTERGPREMLVRLGRGETEVSYRRNIPLDIEQIIMNFKGE